MTCSAPSQDASHRGTAVDRSPDQTAGPVRWLWGPGPWSDKLTNRNVRVDNESTNEPWTTSTTESERPQAPDLGSRPGATAESDTPQGGTR